MRWALGWLLVVVLGTAAHAEGPARSIRPLANPHATSVAAPVVAEPATSASPAVPHPKPRPASLATYGVAETVAAEPALPPDPVTPEATSLRPRPRPQDLGASVELASAPVAEEEAPTTKSKKREKQTKKGSVCGDPAIKGERLAPIKAKVKGCGLAEPVKITSIDGIRLNQPATISCDTASAFKEWINSALRPAMGNREVVEIRIAASYICRTRNNVKGAKISEHGRGKALDVAGFVFSDGKVWTVASDYNKQIRKAHKGACGIFGTTLGPGSDGYHEDHLHFDIARYNGGPYCR